MLQCNILRQYKLKLKSLTKSYCNSLGGLNVTLLPYKNIYALFSTLPSGVTFRVLSVLIYSKHQS